MKRALLIAVLSMFSTEGYAANQTTTKILALDDAKAKTFWLMYLKQSREKCDRVVRTMYQGGTKDGNDSWSVACADGHEYSVGIDPGSSGATTILSCAELKAMDAALMRLAGKPPSNDLGCWIKFKD